ncbi:hypothetical protein [Cupriavidus necator]
MNKKKFILCAISVLSLDLGYVASTANAQTSQSSDTRIGCVYRTQTGARFIDASTRNRDEVANDIQAIHKQGINGLVDPCLAGQTRNVPAAVYQAMARRSPTTFQVLVPQPASVDQATTATSRSLGQFPPAAGFRFRYAYLNLDALAPSGFFPLFIPVGITDNNRVVGNVYDNDFNGFLAIYERGAIKVLSPGAFPTAVSHLGNIGGYVITDPNQGLTQAALFREHSIELIPRAPGEISSLVFTINDFGVAIIGSFDANGQGTPYIYANGKLRPLNLNLEGNTVIATINNFGTVVGYRYLNGIYTAYRHNIITGHTTLLPPLPTEPHSWALGVNDLGDVVGYSFVISGLERIGIWNPGARFETYFTEGTPEYPTISNFLLINNSRLIVITLSFNDPQSYIVPRKGTRLALADLIDYDATADGAPRWIFGLNNSGAMTGTTFLVDFLITPKLSW